RIEAPIPGKSAIGIEIPNKERMPVLFSDLETACEEHPLVLPIGVDLYGKPVVGDLRKMPHLLVAGATGSGKSVCINGIISNSINKAEPDQVRLLLIDPKKVEFTPYNGVPHLLGPVVTDPKLASEALKKLVGTMEMRYQKLAERKV